MAALQVCLGKATTGLDGCDLGVQKPRWVGHRGGAAGVRAATTPCRGAPKQSPANPPHASLSAQAVDFSALCLSGVWNSSPDMSRRAED